ncbi:MAG: hypothetical protein M1837_002123 [Sclerophora amabilis]|nr:MAG: hypothetical protein M1837_002123 [Sclerophora amabilis]
MLARCMFRRRRWSSHHHESSSRQVLMGIALLMNNAAVTPTAASISGTWWCPRPFSSGSGGSGSTALLKKQMPSRPQINEADITESFLKGSGPGGQKINKTSSAVQLKHLPSGTVVKSQETRSRSQNRKIARRVLAEKLELVEKGAESRVAVKAGVVRRKKQSRKKKAKRKYRRLEGGKMGVVGGDEEDADRDEVEEDEKGDVVVEADERSTDTRSFK